MTAQPVIDACDEFWAFATSGFHRQIPNERTGKTLDLGTNIRTAEREINTLMKLHYYVISPYARKTLVFAHEIGLADRIEVVHCHANPMQRDEELFALNPLGKIPVLTTDDGKAIFESSIICEYLDELHSGEKLIPSDISERVEALQLQAVADGMSEAGILAVWESTRRPKALRYPAYLDGQLAKVNSAYDFIEQNVSLAGPLNVGHIALATTLSWLEFRSVASFRDTHPKMAAWHDAFCLRDSMKATPLSV
jgi:glutathione S-transferase